MKTSYISEKLDDLKLISRWYSEEWGHLNSSMTEEKIYEGLSSKLEKHWIGGVFVKPEHRGNGCAAALIEKAKVHTSKLGITELYLQCQEHNEGLYLKHGFKPLHPAAYFSVRTTIFKCILST